MTVDRYRTLLGRLDEWFDRGRREAAGVVPCRGGCSACCHGPFDISVADAELVQGAVAALAPEVRERVVHRAAALLQRMGELEPAWAAPYDVADLGEDRFDRLADALADEPCPLLDDTGRCAIYHDRPLVCRLIGLGMRASAARVIANECPIRDRFPAYARLAPVPFDLDTFEALEAELLEAAARRAGRPVGFETTIAGAVTSSRG